jgi:hypothetical protein
MTFELNGGRRTDRSRRSIAPYSIAPTPDCLLRVASPMLNTSTPRPRLIHRLLIEPERRLKPSSVNRSLLGHGTPTERTGRIDFAAAGSIDH